MATTVKSRGAHFPLLLPPSSPFLLPLLHSWLQIVGGLGGGRDAPLVTIKILSCKSLLHLMCNVSCRERIEQYLPPTCKLAFVNTMSDKIFTKREVQAAGGGPLMIKMVVSNQRDSNCSQLLSANVKVVALDGDFNASNRESWTLEEFESHIVRPRDKVGVVLTGNLELKLRNGEAYLENITFGDISKFTRSGKFRLGVKLIDNLGERVQEGITEPFAVRDRRGEGNPEIEFCSIYFTFTLYH